MGQSKYWVPRPPMLLACCADTGNWHWYMHSTYMDKTLWVKGCYCGVKSTDLLAIDDVVSDPEAIEIWKREQPRNLQARPAAAPQQQTAP